MFKSFAQTVVYQLVNTEKPLNYFKLPYKIPQDSILQIQTLHKIIQTLQQKGFLLANVDKWQKKDDTLYITLHIGKQYRGFYLNVEEVSPYILSECRIRIPDLQKKLITPSTWKQIYRKLLTYAENHGFPFAEVKLDSVYFSNQNLYANLKYRSYFQVTLDTIILHGNLKIRYSYLMALMNLQPRAPFQQQKITNAFQTLRQQPYLRLTKEPLITFVENKAQIHLFTEHRKANQIDGILGILPNAQQNTRTVITGQLDIQLHHLLYSGKQLALKWQRMHQDAQLLNILYEHPHFLKTGITTMGALRLLRQDSSFQNVMQELRLSYPASLGKFSVFAKRMTSSVPIKNISTDIAAFQIISYGLGYHLQQLDDISFPQKGYKLKLDIWAGNKNTSQFLPDTLIKLKSLQLGLEGEMSYHLKQSSWATMLFRWQSAWVENPYLFLNDLYRIGGINSLRGFNENTFFTQWHHIFTAEQRWRLEEESYCFIFSDVAFLRENVKERAQEQQPWSIGAGISVRTRSGIFSLAYAIGKSEEQPFHPRFSKIHFGLTNRF
ncbi:MAG: BamA/TamA family outer membrane protein [Cytophagales bacterium]|nr:BamA/TamA family outer membrane protein [Cytophagales bacterium]MDW8384429.1 BamA/TamA family outer membrane protein [Flammeovirgaceae bacterium]